MRHGVDPAADANDGVGRHKRHDASQRIRQDAIPIRVLPVDTPNERDV
jgi:hypothetical protein